MFRLVAAWLVTLALAFIIGAGRWPQAALSASQELEQSAGRVLSGRVLTSGTRAPVAGVEVELSAPDRTLIYRASAVGVTDDSGRFSFPGLIAAEYEIQLALESSHLSTGRKTVVLPAAGLSSEVELWLIPHAEISGRILDEQGVPVRRAPLGLLRIFQNTDGQSYAAWTGIGADTREDGTYSVSAPPGTYYISVRWDDAEPVSYYPGSVDLDDAIPVTIGRAATDMPGINVSIRSPEGAEAFRVQFRLETTDVASLPWPAGGADGLSEDIRVCGGSVQDDGGTDVAPCPSGTLRARVRRTRPGLVGLERQAVDLENLGGSVYRTPPLPRGDYEFSLSYDTSQSQVYPELDWSQLNPIARLYFTLEDRDLDLGTIGYGLRHRYRWHSLRRARLR